MFQTCGNCYNGFHHDDIMGYLSVEETGNDFPQSQAVRFAENQHPHNEINTEHVDKILGMQSNRSR